MPLSSAYTALLSWATALAVTQSEASSQTGTARASGAWQPGRVSPPPTPTPTWNPRGVENVQPILDSILVSAPSSVARVRLAPHPGPPAHTAGIGCSPRARSQSSGTPRPQPRQPGGSEARVAAPPSSPPASGPPLRPNPGSDFTRRTRPPSERPSFHHRGWFTAASRAGRGSRPTEPWTATRKGDDAEDKTNQGSPSPVTATASLQEEPGTRLRASWHGGGGQGWAKLAITPPGCCESILPRDARPGRGPGATAAHAEAPFQPPPA